MNQRLLSVFVFAIVVAGLASLLVYRFVAQHLQSAAPVVTTTLLVADHDLELGALIGEADLKPAAWNGPIPALALVKTEDAVGRGVITKIYKNEPILSERLAAKGAGAGLAATIPLGMRAVALRVDDVVGLAGFVLPGMRVDVLVAGTGPVDNRLGTISKTVLQNLEVLSANQRIDRNTEGKPQDAQVVNLLVTPEQAEILNLASLQGKVQLVMRNPLDTKEQITHGFSTMGLFGGALPAQPEPIVVARLRAPAISVARPRPEPLTVEVFSGTKRSEQRFDPTPEAR